MPAHEPLLACRGLTRRPWFEDYELAIEAGEIGAISAPTGTGKTLLLRAIADLDPVDSGEVFLRGGARSRLSPPAWRRQVLYVHPGGVRLAGTVADNLAAVHSLKASGDGPDAAAAPLPALEGAAAADRLSSGEAQLLALQRALLLAPAVLLLDESTSALDRETASEVERGLRAYADGGRAVLWVSHDLELADRVGARRIPFP